MADDKPLSKLRRDDRQLVEAGVSAIEQYDHQALAGLIPQLLERQLLNYRKASPLQGTFLNFALSLNCFDCIDPPGTGRV